jgi:hypothetical protein
MGQSVERPAVERGGWGLVGESRREVLTISPQPGRAARGDVGKELTMAENEAIRPHQAEPAVGKHMKVLPFAVG